MKGVNIESQVEQVKTYHYFIFFYNLSLLLFGFVFSAFLFHYILYLCYLNGKLSNFVLSVFFFLVLV